MTPARLTPARVALTLALCLYAAGCASKPKVAEAPAPTQTAYSQAASPRSGSASAPTQVPVRSPKKIVLFVGDGMGTAALTAASYAAAQPLSMLGMSRTGLMRTHGYEFLTTDSAASATALATGHKTHFEGVSVRPGTRAEGETDPGNHLETLVEAAKKRGMRTGLVATSRIVHATPAAFASHRANRRSYDAIAEDMAASGVDLMLGAGRRFFQEREDGRDLLAEMAERGWVVTGEPEAASDALRQGHRVVGLFHDEDMPGVSSKKRATSLAAMTRDAIGALDRDNPDGFFLLVEGSFIDWGAHDMNGRQVIDETLDLDAAVRVALQSLRGDPDALVVVTADHETGGLAVLEPDALVRHERALGGAKKANQGVGTSASGATYADAIWRFPLGFGPMRPPYARKDHLGALSFGYLSVASRAPWNKEGPLYAAHTATMVPLFAEGRGESLVARVRDNAELGELLHGFVDGERGDPVKPSESGDAGDRPAKASRTPSASRGAEVPSMDGVKNVIVMIGDGMGVATVTAGYYAGAINAMIEAPGVGLVATHGADQLVNDSAATATALSTGRLAQYGAVGLGAPSGGEQAPTVLEIAEGRGMRTGLVSTAPLTHATPAAFYAHVPSRGEKDAIARHFTDLPDRIEGADGVDVAIAGAGDATGPAFMDALREGGWEVSEGWSDEPLGARSVRLIGNKLEASALARSVTRGPSLAAMTEAAIASLKNERGFFLMVEGGQIDWALHDLDSGERLMAELEDFDGAVAAAKEWAEASGDTLVIVTADHDHSLSLIDNHYGFVEGACGAEERCGGGVKLEQLAVRPDVDRGEGFAKRDLQGEWGAPMLTVQYAWPVQEGRMRAKLSGPHAATFVPLFAFGTGAERWGRFWMQDELGRALVGWAGGT